MNPELEKIFAQKRARRRWLAALPFPEKIRILVRLLPDDEIQFPCSCSCRIQWTLTSIEFQ